MTGRRWGALAIIALLLAGGAWWLRARRSSPAGEAGAPEGTLRRHLGNRELRRWAADPGAALTSVSGTVEDADGRPVPGAQVVASASTGHLRGGSDPWTVETAGATTAGPDGRYRLAGLKPGAYHLTATAPDATTGFRDRITLAPGEERTGVDIRLGREGVTVSGRLLDSGGGPIAGGRVLAALVGTERIFATASDGQGRYRLKLARGWYRLSAQASGYAPTTEWLSVQGNETRDLRLHAAARIAGVVVSDTGAPIAGAAVRLVGTERTSREQRQTESDAAGAFAFADLQPGTYELLARKGGLVGRQGAPVAVVLAGSADGLRIVLHTGRRVTGRVRTRQGQPQAGALVSATPQQLYGQAKDRLSVQSAPDGSFVLEGLFPGRFQLLAEASGRAARKAEVAVGSTDVSGVELLLDDEAVVVGRVIDGGSDRGVPDAEVVAWLQTGAYRNDQFEQAHTAADGSFRIEGLPAGQLVLQVQHSSGIASLGPEALAAGETRRVTLRLAGGATVAGRVSYTDGTAAVGADVRPQLMMNAATSLPGASTDQNGAYTLTSLPPGDVAILAGPPGQPTQTRAGSKPSFARMKLATGEHREGVDLTIQKADLTIEGTVSDDRGKPVEGAVVSAGAEWFHGYAGGADHRNILTRSDGRFVIPDVMGETYTVWAAHPHYPTATSKAVRGGEKAARIVLRSPSSLAGRVVTSDDKPVVAYDILAIPAAQAGESIEEREERLWGVTARRQSIDDPSGAFVFRGLTAGRYELSVTTPDHRAGTLADVEVAEGGARNDLRVVLKDAATLKGRVIEYGSGKPIASAQVVARGVGLDLQTTADENGRFELVGVPTGGLVSLFVSSYWETHVLDRQEITVPPEAGTVAMTDVKLQPGKLDWAAPDAGFCGMSPVTRDGKPTVGSLRPGQPAIAAGVKVGDLILAVNGTSVLDACGSTVDFLMRGRAGEKVSLNLQTPGQAPREVSFVRAGR